MDPYTHRKSLLVVLRRNVLSVPQAAKRLSKEDIQLLLTAKEADNTGD